MSNNQQPEKRLSNTNLSKKRLNQLLGNGPMKTNANQNQKNQPNPFCAIPQNQENISESFKMGQDKLLKMSGLDQSNDFQNGMGKFSADTIMEETKENNQSNFQSEYGQQNCNGFTQSIKSAPTCNLNILPNINNRVFHFQIYNLRSESSFQSGSQDSSSTGFRIMNPKTEPPHLTENPFLQQPETLAINQENLGTLTSDMQNLNIQQQPTFDFLSLISDYRKDAKKTLDSIQQNIQSQNFDNTQIQKELTQAKTHLQSLVKQKQGIIDKQNNLHSIQVVTLEKQKAQIEEQHLQKQIELERQQISVEEVRSQCLQKQEYFDNLKEGTQKLEGQINVLKEDSSVLQSKLLVFYLELKGNIRVFVRLRPVLPQDLKAYGGSDDSFQIATQSIKILNNSQISIDDDKKETCFNFDNVFGNTISQSELYSEVSPLIRSFLDGYDVVIFAYGQTGSGKTYTMGTEASKQTSDKNLGIIPRAIKQILKEIDQISEDEKPEMRLSFQEIYNEVVRDLMNKNNTLVQINQGCKYEPESIVARDEDHIMQLLKIAESNRVVAETMCNERSSRSHSVCQIRVRKSTLCLIDLAGSERLNTTKVEGDKMKETLAINKSLSALADVISALKEKKHVPYRNSKLTYILSNYLGSESSKTLMIVNLNPVSVNESLCSLRFASKVNQQEQCMFLIKKDALNLQHPKVNSCTSSN